MHQEIIPQVRAWTKVEDIASIHIEMPFSGWLEIADPPKWDPRNRETADHSMPYEAARALIDGDIYVDSFTHEKIMDPVVRQLTGNMIPFGRPRLSLRTNAYDRAQKRWQSIDKGNE